VAKHFFWCRNRAEADKVFEPPPQTRTSSLHESAAISAPSRQRPFEKSDHLKK